MKSKEIRVLSPEKCLRSLSHGDLLEMALRMHRERMRQYALDITERDRRFLKACGIAPFGDGSDNRSSESK